MKYRVYYLAFPEGGTFAKVTISTHNWYIMALLAVFNFAGGARIEAIDRR